MKKKILFVAQNLAVGGIQTSLINLLKVLDEKHRDEYDIDLFVFGKGELLPFVPKGVNVLYGNALLKLASTPFMNVLKSKNVKDIFLRTLLIFYVRITGSEAFYRKMLEKHRINKKYDGAISYFNDVPVGAFNKGTNMFVSEYTDSLKKIAWIHTDPILAGFDKAYCTRLYKNFDRIVCVSKAVKAKMDMLVSEYADKTEVFYNVFPKEEIIEKAREYTPFEKDAFSIVTVGRVDNATKRMDGIVRIVKRLKDEGIEGFKWRIVGAGPDLERNIKLIKELGVSDLVEFTGEKVNPYPYIMCSDLFCLYSAYEGYPMVIGEAEAIGTYVLTTDYAAAKEQISNTQGAICDSDEAFYEKLKNLIKEAL